MSSSRKNLENFAIPLEEIHLATENFSSENRIGDGGFGMVFKGKLSERWQNREAAIKRLNRDGYQGKHEFFNELELVSSLHHHNIIPFIGYCNEDDEMIIVFEYAVKGSLETHLQDRNKRRCLTWEQRLKICLGTARGLKFLHSSGDHFKLIIHRDLKSANILLDENLEAKICDFGLSRSKLRNDPNSKFYTKVAGTEVYTDPDYRRSGKLSKEVDVYSFGIVMFELMTGLLAYYRRKIEDREPKNLIPLVLEYQGNRAYKITDPDIRDEIDDEFFITFNELANKCINLDPRQRPTMDTIITEIEEHLQFYTIMYRSNAQPSPSAPLQAAYGQPPMAQYATGVPKQPMVSYGKWSTGLCGCGDDVSNCCITCLCPCITLGQIAEIVDKGATSCAVQGTLYTLLLTGQCQSIYSCTYRSKMRQQYMLVDEPCNDCILHCCCEPCALCQEYRELKNRGFVMSLGWDGNEARKNQGVMMPPFAPAEMRR